jgi:tetratricopeptide (TPR) repeat protein
MGEFEKPSRRPSSGKPRGGSSGDPRRPQSSGQRNSGQRDSGQRDSGQRGASGTSDSKKRDSPSSGTRGQRGGSAARLSGRTSAAGTREHRPPSDRVSGPSVPEHITGEELDRTVLAELRTLPEGLQEQVAKLLVAIEESLDEDPRLAWEYAQAAKRKAARVSVVREAAGVAAHAAGQYAQSLAELRAVRRMTGSDEHVALMADCERGLGRPRKALELLASVPEDSLSEDARIESRIVAAGARRDLGQVDAALVTLAIPALRSTAMTDWIGRLQYAYADTLAELGRFDEARTWFTKAGRTEADLDVPERLAQLASQE